MGNFLFGFMVATVFWAVTLGSLVIMALPKKGKKFESEDDEAWS